MKRRYSVLQIIILAASSALMYWSMSAEGMHQMAASVSAMVLMVADAVSFASASHDGFTRTVSALIVICAVLMASAICIGSMLPPATPALEKEAEEIPAEEEAPVVEEEKPEPPRVPSAPSVSVRNQEISTGDPEPISGKGSASLPSAPDVFNLIWFEDESI